MGRGGEGGRGVGRSREGRTGKGGEEWGEGGEEGRPKGGFMRVVLKGTRRKQKEAHLGARRPKAVLYSEWRDSLFTKGAWK